MRLFIFLACVLTNCASVQIAAEPEPLDPAVSAKAAIIVPKQQDIATIYFTSDVSEMSADFLDEAFVDAAEVKPKLIVLVINSPGGDVFAMTRMIKTVQESKVPVACIVDGMAASAAGVLLEACHIRSMTPMSLILFHGASTRLQGNESTITGDLSLLTAINEMMAVFVSSRLGMPLAEYQELTRQDFWLGPVTALRLHAIDGIEPSVASFKESLKVALQLNK